MANETTSTPDGANGVADATPAPAAEAAPSVDYTALQNRLAASEAEVIKHQSIAKTAISQRDELKATMRGAPAAPAGSEASALQALQQRAALMDTREALADAADAKGLKLSRGQIKDLAKYCAVDAPDDVGGWLAGTIQNLGIGQGAPAAEAAAAPAVAATTQTPITNTGAPVVTPGANLPDDLYSIPIEEFRSMSPEDRIKRAESQMRASGHNSDIFRRGKK